MQRSGTLVRRLRIRTGPADRSAVQRRVAEMAASLDLSGSWLTPAAILCVRRLDDPRPRRLPLADRGIRPLREWEAAARSRVGELARGAARPARGPVPLSADAVLFLDRSELIACLARDWTDNLAASCWWWTALFDRPGEAAAVMRAWRDAPEHVPAACQLLAAWRCLDRFVERWSIGDATSLTREVARAFRLDTLVPALESPSRSGRGPGGAELSPAASPPSDGTAGTRTVRRALALHAADLPLARLTSEQRTFAVVALMLHRAPHEAPRLLSADAIASIVPIDGPPRSSAELDVAPGASRESSAHRVRGAAHPAIAAEGDAAPAAAGSEPVDRADARPSLTKPADADRNTSAMVDDVAFVEAAPSPVGDAVPVKLAEAIVDTDFGGAFYLINVAIDLGLYPDFTRPRSPWIDLPIWEFIAGVAARLVDDDRFAGDPIVPLLTRLAGRDDAHNASNHSDLFNAFHLSDLSDLPDLPDLSDLPDLPDLPDPPDLPELPDLPGPPDLPDPTDLSRLAARVRARVSEALRIDAGAVGDVVIRRRARVSLSPSHLDIAFALDDLPIAIRLAGLDRDPGFVPAAGLTITFSYV